MGRGDRKDYDDLANSFGNLRENCVRQRSNLAPTPGNVKNICVGLIISIIEYILPCPFTYKEHKIALYREKKTPKSLWGRLRTKGTLENSLLVCFIGWTVGVGLSYLWFESRISQYPELRRVLTWNAAILGLVLSTLIGFTRKGRCLAVLCIPNLTSNAIKTWLLAYIIALVIGGPILNCSNNIKRGGQSLACIKKVTGEELNNAQQKVSRPTGPIKQFCGASSIFSKFLEEYIKDPFRKVKEKTVRMFWFHITMEYHYSYTFTSDKQMIVIADLVRDQGKEELSLQVEGEGAIAGIYKRLTQYPATADTPSEFWDQVTKCISEPVEPDYENAKTILFLHLVVFILVFYALYFLRFRHLICDYFYPERAQKRAVWLYNKIIRSRVWGNSGLITSAKMGSGAGSQVKRKVTCKQRCMACCPGKCDFLWKFLNWRGQTCSICGVEGPLDDQEKFFKCDNKECALVYCVDCVTAFKNNCKGCGQYIIFDTDSDMDYEEDSTDEREKLSKIKGEDMTQSQAENAIIYRWGYDELLNRGREARDLTSKFKEESETDIEGNLAENHINKRKNKQPKATKSIFKGMTAERQYGKEEYGLTPEIVAFCQEKGLDPEYIDVLIEEYEALGIYDRWLQRGGFRSKLKWAKRTVTGEKPTDISLDELNNRLMNRVMDTTKQIKILEVYTDAVRREEEDKNKRNH
ncbi:DgyrCDS3971 [Dimorphilus gyrociliatus]|uniref:DgyrCDS3971 n=1 Tax=Dimorphilus gyrociliatus TaxID=2664684 RepID=A0A7I8VI45_9ANNE|nr:DgyrCDS3971 [Dimorphilus gyrociliatus]